MGKTGKTIGSFVAGAAIGIGLGILFAPDKGTETRAKIKSGLKQKRDELEEKVAGLVDRVKSGIQVSENEIRSAFEDLAANAHEQTDEFVSQLRSKLEEVKEAAAGLVNKKEA